MSDPAAITGATDLLAILGDPIAHARAPMLVNAALARRGANAVLVPMQVSAGDLPNAIAGLRATANFRGAVVTMPHKTAVVDRLDEVTPEARQVGACNVLRRDPDGRLAGAMFDGEGFVAGLRRAGHAVEGRRVLLLGAGGAAAGIAFALAKYGVAVLAIHNRTAARAEDLAARVRRAFPGCAVSAGTPDASLHDIVVNATSLGMKADDALPLAPDSLRPGTIAADIISHPCDTRFLAAAAERGCIPHDGLAMLTAQIELMIDFMLAR